MAKLTALNLNETEQEKMSHLEMGTDGMKPEGIFHSAAQKAIGAVVTGALAMTMACGPEKSPAQEVTPATAGVEAAATGINAATDKPVASAKETPKANSDAEMSLQEYIDMQLGKLRANGKGTEWAQTYLRGLLNSVEATCRARGHEPSDAHKRIAVERYFEGILPSGQRGWEARKYNTGISTDNGHKVPAEK